jgi:hypothetical protein
MNCFKQKNKEKKRGKTRKIEEKGPTKRNSRQIEGMKYLEFFEKLDEPIIS